MAHRTIPTRVGKTAAANGAHVPFTDHPHARGENSHRSGPRPHSNGPSPRAWGKRVYCKVSRGIARTIPTRVGKTRIPSVIKAKTSDHPHARGENLSRVTRGRRLTGPSPRAWGKHKHSTPRERGGRTIPTRVGKTWCPSNAAACITDHPHARGENLHRCDNPACVNGPSPRAWGKRILAREKRKLSRTIPTRVGKTSSRSAAGRPSSDHPHARGENEPWLCRGEFHYGPSPRAWGKRIPGRARGGSRRTIPTRVGKTETRAPLPGGVPDHPHARGENYVHRMPGLLRHGPSPRAWGKLREYTPDAVELRTIPTRVGKTR